MMKTTFNNADVRDWLFKAHDDIRFGKSSLGGGFYPQVCFISQQIAEKALKTHLLIRLVAFMRKRGVSVPEETVSSCEILDRYYLPTRYPDIPAPVNTYTQAIAQEAMNHAEDVLRFVEQELGDTASG